MIYACYRNQCEAYGGSMVERTSLPHSIFDKRFSHSQGWKQEEESTSSYRTCIDGNMEDCRLILPLLRSAPKCRELFEEGSLISPTHWATPACKSKEYAWSDLRSCLLPQNHNHTIAIIGDSRLRQIKQTLINYMTNSTQNTLAGRPFENDRFNQPLLNFHFDYYWRPFADSTVQTLFSRWLNGSDTVDMVIIGVGIWYNDMESTKSYTELGQYYPSYFVNPPPPSEVLLKYEDDLRNLSRLMNELSQRIPIVWVSQGTFDPLRERGYVVINNITKYNEAAEKIWKTTGVTFWKSAHTLSEQTFPKSPDLNHYCEETAKALTNLLWNYYCNSKWNVSSDHCCSSPSQKAP